MNRYWLTSCGLKDEQLDRPRTQYTHNKCQTKHYRFIVFVDCKHREIREKTRQLTARMMCSSARRRWMALLTASSVIFMLSSSGRLLTTQYENAIGSRGIDSNENVSFQLCNSLITSDIRCRCRQHKLLQNTALYTLCNYVPQNLKLKPRQEAFA